MKTRQIIFALAVIFTLSFTAFAQQATGVKRTTYKKDRFDFGVGGTLAIVGAPNGSIRIEGWSNREIEIEAEVTLEAATDADIERLSKVSGFVLQESLGRTGIISVGTHDRKYVRRIDKSFPKALYAAPLRIDYVIRVPRYTDLEIDGGHGDLSVTGVEGNMRINYVQTNATLDLVGGGISATFGSGSVAVSIPSRSWRGRFADVSMANGTMSLNLPVGLNAEFDAVILRTGRIENGYSGFIPRVRSTEFTERSISAKSGTGSIPLRFTVGDGTLIVNEVGRSAAL
jgi:hypothetical protein